MTFQDHTAQLSLNNLPVLTPSQMKEQTNAILEDLKKSPLPQDAQVQLREKLADFQTQWQKVFEKFGQNYKGELAYRDLIEEFREKITPLGKKWLSVSGKESVNTIISMFSTLSLSQSGALSGGKGFSSTLTQQLLRAKRKRKIQQESNENDNLPLPTFEKPIFIVSAPRAGSSLLFETLAQLPDVWTIGDESHEIIEDIAALHPAAHNFNSNRLDAKDATPDINITLRKRWTQQLQNRAGVSYRKSEESLNLTSIRFLEKTPKNALRVPFLKALFPDALFIYLYREAKENISSLLEGWRSQRFISYKPLPGWPYQQWSFLLVPGWQSLTEASIVEIAAYQWQMANQTLIEDLKSLDSSAWCLVNYRDLVEQPEKTINQIAQFAQLEQDEQTQHTLSQPLPIAQRTLSAPASEKWRKHERELATVLPQLETLITHRSLK